jgi:hypothetical protein
MLATSMSFSVVIENGYFLFRFVCFIREWSSAETEHTEQNRTEQQSIERNRTEGERLRINPKPEPDF